MVSRRDFLVTSAKVGLVTATSVGVIGCGGGGNSSNSGGATINTNFNGSLSNVTSTSPVPGAVFISRGSSFTIDFPFGDPPRSFTVLLRRFLEPIGGESFSTPSQAIEINQINEKSWNIRRRNNFELDAGGVYFLDLIASGGQQERFVYIVGSNRSVTENPNTGGNLVDLSIQPAPGSYGISKGIGGQGFELHWDPDFPPPSQFTVQLRRYKERRGNDNGGDSEQQISSQRINDYTYIIRRNSNFDLDGLATYYLEVAAPGQGNARAAFTTS